MAERISDEMMEYIAILAKLSLSEEEAEEAKQDMEQMLDYIDKLKELDTEGVEPVSHTFQMENVFREDIVRAYAGGREKILENAPEVRNGSFVVPKTIGAAGEDGK